MSNVFINRIAEPLQSPNQLDKAHLILFYNFQTHTHTHHTHTHKYRIGGNFRQFRQCLLLATFFSANVFALWKNCHIIWPHKVYLSFGGCCTCIYLEFKALISNLARCRYCRPSKLYLGTCSILRGLYCRLLSFGRFSSPRTRLPSSMSSFMILEPLLWTETAGVQHSVYHRRHNRMVQVDSAFW